MDPCGHPVDLLRSCYSTDVRFYTDSDETNRVTWYWVDSDWPGSDQPVPYNVFSSGNWSWQKSNWPGQGEVLGASRTWRNGSKPLGVVNGVTWCGTDEQWAGSILYSDSVSDPCDCGSGIKGEVEGGAGLLDGQIISPGGELEGGISHDAIGQLDHGLGGETEGGVSYDAAFGQTTSGEIEGGVGLGSDSAIGGELEGGADLAGDHALGGEIEGGLDHPGEIGPGGEAEGGQDYIWQFPSGAETGGELEGGIDLPGDRALGGEKEGGAGDIGSDRGLGGEIEGGAGTETIKVSCANCPASLWPGSYTLTITSAGCLAGTYTLTWDGSHWSWNGTLCTHAGSNISLNCPTLAHKQILNVRCGPLGMISSSLSNETTCTVGTRTFPLTSYPMGCGVGTFTATAVPN